MNNSNNNITRVEVATLAYAAQPVGIFNRATDFVEFFHAGGCTSYLRSAHSISIRGILINNIGHFHGIYNHITLKEGLHPLPWYTHDAPKVYR